jgi:PRC-barrel domain
MISDHNLGALMGAPVTGPNDEKIGTVGQVFVDPDTGKPNWVTVHTGLFGRHESFVPVDDATWDHEVLHVPFEKDVVKDAPRIDTDQALSPEDELSLYRYYRIPTGDVDTSTVGGGNADTREKQESGLDDSDDRHDATESRTTADTEDLSETRDAVGTQNTGEQASGRMRMRRYVIVEEEVPVDSDQGEPGTPGTPRDQRS